MIRNFISVAVGLGFGHLYLTLGWEPAELDNPKVEIRRVLSRLFEASLYKKKQPEHSKNDYFRVFHFFLPFYGNCWSNYSTFGFFFFQLNSDN